MFVPDFTLKKENGYPVWNNQDEQHATMKSALQAGKRIKIPLFSEQ